jgi:outer membrane autotransporter protein
MNRLPLKLGLALFVLVLYAGPVSAQRYWSGTGLNPATAGSGTWDNANSQWSSTFPAYTAATWNNNIANFNGTGGGTVTIGQTIFVNDINFGANAGPFTLLNSGSPQAIFVLGAGITNNSGNTQSITNSGSNSLTEFYNSATAANASIIDSGSGSFTLFFDSATAGNASITNSGAGTLTKFIASATAANATIIDSGASSHTDFFDSATVANASITNSGSASFTELHNGATAGNASITNSGSGSFTLFFDSATAGNASITNSGAGSLTKFVASATAANATITNSGAGSSTDFFDSATAANASITNSDGSFTAFSNNATAANATITNSGGSSFTEFSASASGGNASLINANPGAFIDISPLITGGTAAGSIAGNGFLNLGSKNLTVGGNNTSTTFSGVIQDGGAGGGTGGSLTKVGTGTLVLSGNNIYTGSTNIYEGVLQVDGSTTSDTVVKTDGTLAGNGTIFGSVENHGVVGPGDSPGTLTVSGADYTNQSDGTFRAEIGGLSEGVNADLLRVFGNVYINGGNLEVVRFGNFMPLPGDQVTILRTESVCSRYGQFDTLVPIGWTGLIQPFADYSDPDTVDIVFQLSNTFESQGITPNQMAVGAALDDAVLDNCVPNVIAYLGQEPLAYLPYDYDLIAPEELASIYEMGFTQARMQGVNLMQRMDDIRAGSTGFCSSVAMEMPTPGYSKESNGKEVINKNPAPAFVPTPENRWGIWATGSGQFVNVSNDDDNAPGYDLSNGNFTVGIDYRLLHNLAFGIYGGYDAGVANLTEGGRITTNGGNVGGFATWFWDKFYVDVSGGGTWNNYKTRRTALLGDAVGSTQGAQYNVHGALGYDWHFGCWNVGPRATFQYTDVNIDQFRERGSLAPLNFPDQNEDSLQSTLGVRASYDLHPSKNVIIRPEFSAAWLHEYNDRAYPIDAGFLGCPGGFTVYGPSVGRDGAQVRAGASAQLNPAFAIYVYYDGLLGRGNYSSNGASGGFTWSF